MITLANEAVTAAHRTVSEALSLGFHILAMSHRTCPASTAATTKNG